MVLLYGRHYLTRYRILADLIQPQTTVLDLCCGPAILYRRYLRNKAVNYTGLDINEGFIKRLKQSGSKGMVWDVRRDEPLPQADYVVMQASLYHFLPDPSAVVDRMLSAARRQAIIAEPIRNISNEESLILRTLGSRLSNPGTGEPKMRFTEQTLDKLFAGYSPHILKTLLVPGGREKVFVLDAASWTQSVSVNSPNRKQD